ncbi:Binding-protein-dependent transport systems inner membrane component [Frankia canadensis]|uniref:Binding-protein-dependent transport systems inner membrane component n=1 Tax=Frankia canadensis TaxID=1836972 RepID=A0A2I2KVZ8_9ACTN|nr:ABC transporter permease subunit [Frankia canadensis]SNQ49834.1 Binding-protein-dependent transport systems inner membrane component [Frankia canadensis]SOU57124.1 Binding-protein-dependent transport systems inner membrane component [Frankia canadensis]
MSSKSVAVNSPSPLARPLPGAGVPSPTLSSDVPASEAVASEVSTPEIPASDVPASEDPASGVRDLSRVAPPPGRPRTRVRPRVLRRALRVLVPLLVLAAWAAGSATGLIPAKILDSPPTVVDAFGHLISTHQLQDALSISLRRAGVGLAFGLAVGLVFGLTTGLSRLGEELLDSSMQMVRMVPFLAVTPLIVVWFGIGETAKIALIAFACVFPIYLNTYAAVRAIDPKLIEAARVFGLRGLALTRRLIIPNAMPGILVGLRFSMGVSILALIAAEQINADSGLGYLVANAQEAFRNDLILALLFVYTVLGLFIDLFVRLLERTLLPWRATVVGR